jgi:hypothetical protein
VCRCKPRTKTAPILFFAFVGCHRIDAPTLERCLGAGSRNRTHDQRFTKPLLYQLSYAGYADDFTRDRAVKVTIECVDRAEVRRDQHVDDNFPEDRVAGGAARVRQRAI